MTNDIVKERTNIFNKHPIVSEIDFSKNVLLCIEWDIESPNCGFEPEQFVKYNIPFTLAKLPEIEYACEGKTIKKKNDYGVISIYVPSEYEEIAKAIHKSEQHKLIIDCSGGMLCIEDAEYMKTVLDRLPEGVWQVIGFDTEVLFDKAFKNKDDLWKFFNSKELVVCGGTDIKCLEDYCITDKDYLLSDGYILNEFPKEWIGIKVFKETWFNGDNEHDKRVTTI